MEFNSFDIALIIIGVCFILLFLYKARKALADILGAIVEVFD